MIRLILGALIVAASGLLEAKTQHRSPRRRSRRRKKMAKKRVVVSFDFDNDRHYRALLNAFAGNPNIDIDFADMTPSEIQSDQVDRIKAVLTTKISQATHMLVIVGEHINAPHRNRAKIGEINWQLWEIKKAVELRKPIIAVKLDRSYSTPALLGQGVTWIHSFNRSALEEVLGN
ncbi:hypothetical protein amb1155 [Paramagnetospirillum magneticum AMB-1]|uniref:Thoeris protein ThsB TIR-like domain-containing protein n=2 Tax=Paramagnetospirillum magneticum TaxID=84159 RepID=Q2W866_PARM1|nr:hypothetical protein amb1155 [Paramagnetospirillum magneticum AMB-1]